MKKCSTCGSELPISKTCPLLIVENTGITDSAGAPVAQVRSSGNFEGRAVWLNNKFDWEIKKDSVGSLVAVPYLKP